MTINAPDAEKADVTLRSLVRELQIQIDEGSLLPEQMIRACRQILHLWLRMGGDTTEDAVVGFLGIESETDYVLGGSQSHVGRPVDHVRFKPGSAAEAQEVEEVGRFYLEYFSRDIEELNAYLNVG
ncbi:MAG TPA: hypothetical protein VK485_07440 [Sphingomicrobium sp.]|nr:hypothetical protein [Sphingomicrobium sp.]